MLFSHAVLAAETDAPEGTLIEAEDATGANKYGNVVEDADASGGKAVTSNEAWRPVFRYDIGDDLPDKVTIHVRYKGGPLILKARVDGKNGDLKAKYDKPDKYTWVNFGTFKKSELGDRIEIIRGKNEEQPHVDAVVFSSDGGGAEPQNTGNADTPQNAGDAGGTGEAAGGDSGGGEAIPPYRPSPDAPVIDAEVSIDWDADAGPLTDKHWGIALFHPVKGTADGDRPYIDYLVDARPGVVRVHHSNQGKFWMNPAKTSFDDGEPAWDVDVIRRALAPVKAMREAGVEVELIVCHGYWPTWFNDGKYIPAEDYDQALALTRELVETCAATGVRVDAWELFNEADNTYEKRDKLDELFTLFNLMADAVRETDPTAKVGGPALTWANPKWVKPFLDTCGAKIDFFSWHNYAGGKPTVPNATMLGQVSKIREHAAFVRGALAERGLDDVETYLTEVNVQWTWKPFERRHANNVGAVFLASMVTGVAAEGVTGITMWQDKGNAYGLIDSEDQMRATGQLYSLSHWMTGRRGEAAVSGLSPDPELSKQERQNPGVRVVPVVRQDGELPGGRSLVLINEREETVNVMASAEVLSQMTSLLRIDADGLLVEPFDGGTLSLPGWSVTLLLDVEAPMPLGRHELPGQHVSFNW